MQVDATMHLVDVRTISIERVPSRGLVRIKIKGDKGGWTDEMSITVWGDPRTQTMPEIVDTTAEPPVNVLAEEEEEADI